MSKWSNSDTSKYSGDSNSKVSAAEHQAREDATKAGIFERGNDSKNSQPLSKSDDSGSRATSFWDSLFGSKK